jgi:hypothetical protein
MWLGWLTSWRITRELVVMTEPQLVTYAACGHSELAGMVWRRGDALKHLGPLEHLAIPMRSKLFLTRCGLSATDGSWATVDFGPGGDDFWCPRCLMQAGIPYVEREL